MDLSPVSLEGTRVRLVPLSLSHHSELCEVSLNGDLFRYFPDPPKNAQELRTFLEQALAAQEAKMALPFSTVEVASGKLIGGTRFGNISTRDRRIEIGWTWLGKAWQRSGANTEAKFLMLQYAFEKLGCERVELKTDLRNTQSRAAILRIGATQEGILRKHMVMADGYVRDTVYYSVIREEWPKVRDHLMGLMAT